MAQRSIQNETAWARIAHAIMQRPMLAGLFVVLVLAMGVIAVAGSSLAGGASFEVERASSAASSGDGEEGVGPLNLEEVLPAAGDAASAGGGARDGAVAEGPLIVDVDGAVRVPGVYELAGGARVADAIAAAGGLADDADTALLNQAATVGDGEKVYVPREGEASSGAALSSTGTGAAAGGGGSGQAAGGLVNINTATLEELDALPGIGPATAQAIIDDRDKNGPFTAPDDLMRVSGIGEKKFEKISSQICV